MSHTHAEIQPIPVHVSNAADLAGMTPRQRPRRRIRAVYRTYVLSVANPIYPIAGEDLSRRGGYAIAYGSSVVLCESQSQAQDPANAIAGSGAFALAPANPQGTLLYVPAAVAAGASIFNSGSQTEPASGTTITSVVLPAGTYAIQWTVALSGTLGANDGGNFGLYVPSFLASSLNPEAAGTYPQQSQLIIVPAGGATVSVKNFATTSAVTVYSAQITATPAAGTSPVAQSDRWPLNSNDVIWASAAYLTGAQTAMLTFCLYSEAAGY